MQGSEKRKPTYKYTKTSFLDLEMQECWCQLKIHKISLQVCFMFCTKKAILANCSNFCRYPPKKQQKEGIHYEISIRTSLGSVGQNYRNGPLPQPTDQPKSPTVKDESTKTPKYLMDSFSLIAFLLILMVTCCISGLLYGWKIIKLVWSVLSDNWLIFGHE